MHKEYIINKVVCNPVILGKIGKAYGILGWVKIISFTENIQDIFRYRNWYLHKNNIWTQINLEKWKYSSNSHPIAKFKFIEKREVISNFTHSNIVIDYSQLAKLSNNTYYWRDLIGCLLYKKNGKKIGKVVNLIETKYNDVMIVQSYQTHQKFAIPFLKSIVRDVDILNRKIAINGDMIDFT
ncbi:16S rRNA processing protein RimM [Candidatus Schneideria nysicola]|nr:16S rRNA processing protein RimM [Candidatus Schneideria nysicola]